MTPPLPNNNSPLMEVIPTPEYAKICLVILYLDDFMTVHTRVIGGSAKPPPRTDCRDPSTGAFLRHYFLLSRPP